VIDQLRMVKKILAHLGLPTEAQTNPEGPIWLPKESTLRGPPAELLPPDLDDAGLLVGLNAVDEERGEPMFGELPAEDWAAELGIGGSAGWRRRLVLRHGVQRRRRLPAELHLCPSHHRGRSDCESVRAQGRRSMRMQRHGHGP
jgi:hypothetical protein